MGRGGRRWGVWGGVVWQDLLKTIRAWRGAGPQHDEPRTGIKHASQKPPNSSISISLI